MNPAEALAQTERALTACAAFLPGDQRDAYHGKQAAALLPKLLAETNWGFAVPFGLRAGIEELQDAASLAAMRGMPDFTRYRNVVAGAGTVVDSELQRVVADLREARHVIWRSRAAAREAGGATDSFALPSERLRRAIHALRRLHADLNRGDREIQLRFRLRALHAEAQRAGEGRWARALGAALCAYAGIALWLIVAGIDARAFWLAAITDVRSVMLAAACAGLSLALSLLRAFAVRRALRVWNELSPDGDLRDRSRHALSRREPGMGWMWNLERRYLRRVRTPMDRFLQIRPCERTSCVVRRLSDLWEGSRRARRAGLWIAGVVAAVAIGFYGRQSLNDPVSLVVADPPALGARCEVVHGELIGGDERQWFVVGADGLRAVPKSRVERMHFGLGAPAHCVRAPLDGLVSLGSALLKDYPTPAHGDRLRRALQWTEAHVVQLICIQSKRRVKFDDYALHFGGRVDAENCTVIDAEPRKR